MTIICYNEKKQQWFHQDEGRTYVFGYQHPLSFSNELPSFSFHVKEQRGKVGPLVGIMISESSIPALLKRKKRYIELITTSLQEAGSIGIVLPFSSIYEKFVQGYVFVRGLGQWVSVTAPLPDVFYNRIKSRLEEKTNEFQRTIELLENLHIPFFNRSFFTKWELYETLQKNDQLRPHLPATLLVHDTDDIRKMLQTYGSVYVKPNEGAKGKGLFRLTSSPLQTHILYEQINVRKTLTSLEELNPLLSSTRYIVQQAIDADTWKGNRYDLRVLVHYQHGAYAISGIGVRLSQAQQLTTHVLSGGKLLPYSEVKHRIDEALLCNLISECGKEMSKHFGFIGEFSADIGLSKDGQLYVYELNAKPMIFDEPDIQRHGAKQLISLFDELTGFLSS
jgi:glutathione synthase/RimK-type ligase-like ATP-grasp enzyme